MSIRGLIGWFLLLAMSVFLAQAALHLSEKKDNTMTVLSESQPLSDRHNVSQEWGVLLPAEPGIQIEHWVHNGVNSALRRNEPDKSDDGTERSPDYRLVWEPRYDFNYKLRFRFEPLPGPVVGRSYRSHKSSSRLAGWKESNLIYARVDDHIYSVI